MNTERGWRKEAVGRPEVIPELPRITAVVNFGPLTGHGCLAKHMHRIGCSKTPLCPLCNENAIMIIMNAKHLEVWKELSDQDHKGNDIIVNWYLL